jgi:hypothetical protein
VNDRRIVEPIAHVGECRRSCSSSPDIADSRQIHAGAKARPAPVTITAFTASSALAGEMRRSARRHLRREGVNWWS